MAFEIKSVAFENSKTIPKKYTGEGENTSPPLTWKDVPEGTKELALICEDPDASKGVPFVHWLAYKIPPDLMALPEAVPSTQSAKSPPAVLQGKNSFEKPGYGGPMPPKQHGRHRYFFKLYALDTELQLKPGIDRAEFEKAIEGHIIEEADLMGTYERFGQ